MTLFEVAQEIQRRLSGIFLRDADGQRPVYGGTTKFQDDPHWRDLILFYEYFHGDNGAGSRRQPPDRMDRHGRAAAGPLRPRRRQDGSRDRRERMQARLVREQVGGDGAGQDLPEPALTK